MSGTFKPPLLNPFLYSLFAALNRPLLSRGVKWIVDEASWANWDRIPADSAYFIASKHAHFNDHFCIGGLAAERGLRCWFVSIPEAFEQFWGAAGFIVRCLGAFPVERGGKNVHAMRFIVEALVEAEHPLVIFPEGELYFLNDVVTPLKQGIALFALEGAKARDLAGKPGSVCILPVGLKYVYPGDAGGLLESKLAFCEKEFYGKPRSGEGLNRIFELTGDLEQTFEKRYEIRGSGKTGWERFYSLSAPLVDALETQAGEKASAGDLADRGRRLMAHFKKRSRSWSAALFAVHCLDFLPGYLDQPTPERQMEALRKLERLITGNENPSFPGQKRLHVKIEPPLEVHPYLAAYLKRETRRAALANLTADLQKSMEKAMAALTGLTQKAGQQPRQAGISG